MPNATSPAFEHATRGPVPKGTVRTSLRTLFALDEKEVEVFFGDRSVLQQAGGDFFHTTRGAEWQRRLEEYRPEVIVSCWSTPPIPESWLKFPDCPLRYVCHVTGSIRKVVPRFFLESGGRATNWGGLAAQQVAEQALLLMLAALRNLPEWRTGNWNCKFTTRTLFGKSVGLHGFGRIAQALRELLRPFGGKVLAFSRGVPDSLMESFGVEPCGSLEELFSNSEVLVECEALTDHTRGSVTAAVLAALPGGAVFVNVGRGLVVDEASLIREVSSGRIRAALDVVCCEPLDPESELAGLPNLIYSPHIGGPTGDRLLRCGRLALENLDRYRRGLPLEAEVTLTTYDRST